MKKYNFYAGPAILPRYTIENTAKAVLELDDIGLSVMEISHRSKEFEAVMKQAQTLFKELLQIPDGYYVLFLGGGARLQFAMVPFNILEKKAAYLNTGVWATGALEEAKLFGDVVEIANSENKDFSRIPKDYEIPTDCDYFHITTNNTIYGTEIKEDIDSPIPLVADMSSDIFSRPMDISKYTLIYGGAQKNLAPAGVTFVVVKESILGKVSHPIPKILDYRTHIKKDSMYNTPPVVSIYGALQTLKWLKNNGGVEAMYKTNMEKATMLYDEIERNTLFKPTVALPDDRSIMNVSFVMEENYKPLEKDFLDFAESYGIVGIKGHRYVGGFRASIYNAMEQEGVKKLVEVMKEFENKKC